MEFKRKTFVLRDGKEIEIRNPKSEDALKMIEFLKTVSGETYFLLRDQEDVRITEEKEKEFLKEYIESDRNIMIAAFMDGEVVGNAVITGIGNLPKIKHRADFAISIRKKDWNKGIGSLLMNELFSIAKDLAYEQIELGVYEDNDKAKLLYERFGFEEWGRIKRAFKLNDGTYRDEITMGKNL